MDIVEEARAYRSAMGGWMERLAVGRRVDLQLGRPSVAPADALRSWSRSYFESPSFAPAANVTFAPGARAAESPHAAALAL